MKAALRFFSLAAAFLLFFRTAAGELDALARELDDIERNFWTAAAMPSDSIAKEELNAKIRSYRIKIMDFQQKLQRSRIPNAPNLLAPCVDLQTVFELVKPSQIPGWGVSLRETGMSAYQREFQRSQRFKQKNTRDLPKYPTLKLVNAVSYASWVDSVCQSNLQRLRVRYDRSGRSGKKNKHGSRPLSSAIRNSFETYILAIARLRAGFVSLAQNKFYQEKPKPQEPPHVRKNH
jgi:hypothetical protein